MGKLCVLRGGGLKVYLECSLLKVLSLISEYGVIRVDVLFFWIVGSSLSFLFDNDLCSRDWFFCDTGFLGECYFFIIGIIKIF